VRAEPERNGKDFISFQSFISFFCAVDHSLSFLSSVHYFSSGLLSIFHDASSCHLFSFITSGERINFWNMSEDKIPSLYSVHRAWLCPPTRRFAAVINITVCSAQLLILLITRKHGFLPPISRSKIHAITNSSFTLLPSTETKMETCNSFRVNLTLLLTIVC
jgi:hypothetical protein